MVFPELQDLLALVLEADRHAIAPETCPEDLPNWSSLTFMVVMAGIEKRFGVAVDHERAIDARTVRELADLIAAAQRASADG